MRISLQAQLVLAVSVLAVAAIAAVALSARQSARVEFRRFQDLETHAPSGQPSVNVATAGDILHGRCCSFDVMQEVEATLGRTNAAVLVVDETGTVVATAGSRATELRKATVKRDGDETVVGFERWREGRVEGVSLKLVGVRPRRITMTDGRPADVLAITVPTDDLPVPAVEFQGAIDRQLLYATVIVSVVVIGLTWVVARRIVRPIDELGRAAAALGAGDLSRRVTVRGSDEVATLGTRFNAMAEELARQQEIRRGLLHDVTHELRTPLTALQCRLETAIDGLVADPRQALDQAHEEVRHLTRLVEDLEVVALAEARDLRLDITAVPVAGVAASAAAATTAEGSAPARIDVEPGLVVRADPVRLRQVLLNLLTNAARHTPSGGTITVRARRDADHAIIEVHNTGSTIAAADLERVFDRFYRADPARQRSTGGTGLGLAIVKHLVEAQGGRVSARSGEDGVAFAVELPL